MPFIPQGERVSKHIDELTKEKQLSPATIARLRGQGAIRPDGFMWVETMHDPATGATQLVAWVGEPGAGGKTVIVSETEGYNIAEKGPGDTAEQLNAVTMWLDTEIGRGTFTVEQAMDIRRGLAEKISGKDKNRDNATNIANNLLALAPKVDPSQADIFSKVGAAMLLASGVFGDFMRKPTATQPTSGFVGDLARSAVESASVPQGGQVAAPRTELDTAGNQFIPTLPGVKGAAEAVTSGIGQELNNPQSVLGRGINAVGRGINAVGGGSLFPSNPAANADDALPSKNTNETASWPGWDQLRKAGFPLPPGLGSAPDEEAQ